MEPTLTLLYLVFSPWFWSVKRTTERCFVLLSKMFSSIMENCFDWPSRRFFCFFSQDFPRVSHTQTTKFLLHYLYWRQHCEPTQYKGVHQVVRDTLGDSCCCCFASGALEQFIHDCMPCNSGTVFVSLCAKFRVSIKVFKESFASLSSSILFLVLLWRFITT